MTIYKLLAFSALIYIAVSCNENKSAEENPFEFEGSVLKAQYTALDSVTLAITNASQKKIDSVVYYVNATRAGSGRGGEKVTFPLASQKLGYQNLKATVHYEGNSKEVSERIELVSSIQPELLNYTVVATYPHDITAFTEGLEFYRDTLMESTGQHGSSWIRKYDFKSGRIHKQIDLERKYFGEGMTVLKGKIYQLTWQEKTGFIYDANTGKLERTFPYDKDIEGWGMTNDGKYIYHSDGTEKIWKLDPSTLKMIDYVNVYSSTSKIKSINELEYIDGKIYGNIWQKDAIAVIDPASGSVLAVLNLSDLRKELKNPQAEVLNGIAYNPKTKTIFVTGKHWDKMFEIKVSNPI